MRRVPGAFAAIVVLGVLPALAEPGFVPIELRARTIDSFDFDARPAGGGVIAFRGGLSLSSSDRDFGAISGIEFTPDGRLVGIADTGFWVSFQLVEEDGWLRGISEAMVAPMLSADGTEANLKTTTDAEGLRLMPDGRSVIVSFEQDHRLELFALPDLAMALPQAPSVTLPDLSRLSANRGLEAIAIAPAGGPLGEATVVFSEEGNDGRGGLRAWVLDGPRAGEFSVRRNGLFNITDAAFLPNGDLFILERQFSLSDGIAMRIRRLSSEDIRPGALVDGPVVLFDDHLFQIDNMEGMALRPLPSGEVLITVASDNNHSLLQRNLLLQFLWSEGSVPLPPPRPAP